jgi:exodeoxyribonuclease VII large subunit
MKQNQLGFDFQDTAVKPETPKVLSVADLNAQIRSLLEGEFPQIWVRGEISNFKPHTSGHYYFSLKDDSAQISAVMFRGHNSKLKFKPENGLEVLIRGKITVYEPRGNYQIFCEYMEPVGAGALQKAFEQLKAKLQAEGLFAPERKRPLPAFPKHIGLVTSPTGAAIRDILNVLRRRFKAAKITLSPAVVQGDAAPESIVNAIQMINQLSDVDVLIVGRGGGSMEDLWCFNDERVARAIAQSKIPVISAVGHEVDFTIADFVADLRAPTPSAAAELVVKNASDLAERIELFKARLVKAMSIELRTLKERALALQKQLVDPRRRLQDLILRADELTLRLENSMLRHLEALRQEIPLAMERIKGALQKLLHKKQVRFRELSAQLDALSPLKVVERGYSIVTLAKTKKLIKSTSDLKTGDSVNVTLAEGKFLANVTEIQT